VSARAIYILFYLAHDLQEPKRGHLDEFGDSRSFYGRKCVKREIL
jgi:hypothetical protein